MRSELAVEFPRATLIEDRPALEGQFAAVEALLAGETPALPLDIEATAFQARVWQALLRIPRGTTVSYGELARAIGQPQAVRAVAGACAANPVALVVPCHRVVGRDGALTGYRWGVERKRDLLAREGRQATGPEGRDQGATVISREPRSKVKYDQIHCVKTCSLLLKSARNWMCTKAQASHARSPRGAGRRARRPRSCVRRQPDSLVAVAERRRRGAPATRAATVFPTWRPLWIATGATPGSGRPSCSRCATSPIDEAPRAGPAARDRTRPSPARRDRRGAEQAAAGVGLTPAVQST